MCLHDHARHSTGYKQTTEALSGQIFLPSFVLTDMPYGA